MATHELVVPKSIPITSPASAADDCHRMERTAFVAEDRKVEAVVRPLRIPICKDIITIVFNQQMYYSKALFLYVKEREAKIFRSVREVRLVEKIMIETDGTKRKRTTTTRGG